MDKIHIEKLKIFCHHGLYEFETENGQNFYVSADIYMDTYEAGEYGSLDKSVNYAELCQKITKYMQDNTYALIETVAESLAIYILSQYTVIKGLSLTIHKPEAPIGLPFDDVSVTIERFWKKAYIAIGSNIGDSQQIIDEAINKIASDKGIRLLKKSEIIVTKPYGGVKQPDFLNGCMEIETIYDPQRLLKKLHIIENEAGRTREIHWGPRTLDLDIILYDDLIIHSENLTIPHIDMINRSFVLEPLCEIAPYAYNPVEKKIAGQLLEDLKKRNN